MGLGINYVILANHLVSLITISTRPLLCSRWFFTDRGSNRRSTAPRREREALYHHAVKIKIISAFVLLYTRYM